MIEQIHSQDKTEQSYFPFFSLELKDHHQHLKLTLLFLSKTITIMLAK